MTKLMTVLILVTCTQASLAGSSNSYPKRIDTYSPSGQYYFVDITEQKEIKGVFASKGVEFHTKNIRVFHLEEDRSWKLFPKDLNASHTIVSMEFFPSPLDSNAFNNGQRGNFRNIKAANKTWPDILIVTRENESGNETIYLSTWNANELKKIADVKVEERWHVDQKHKKLRVLSTDDDGDVSMREYSLRLN